MTTNSGRPTTEAGISTAGSDALVTPGRGPSSTPDRRSTSRGQDCKTSIASAIWADRVFATTGDRDNVVTALLG